MASTLIKPKKKNPQYVYIYVIIYNFFISHPVSMWSVNKMSSQSEMHVRAGHEF